MATGSFAINNVPLTLIPSSDRWVDRSPIGITGDGHEIYGRTHEYEMRWNLSSQASVFQLNNYFLAVGITGTVTVALPEYGALAYEFKNYSGCILSELQRGEYFAEYGMDVKLLIRNIVV
jgi:hypothetical protein